MTPDELREIRDQAQEIARRIRLAIAGTPPGRLRDTGLLSVQLNAAHLAAWADLAAQWADDPPEPPLRPDGTPVQAQRWAKPL